MDNLLKYLFVIWILIIPVFIILLWLDFAYNLNIDFFSEYSILRVIFYIYFVVINGVYFYNEYYEEIHDLF